MSKTSQTSPAPARPEKQYRETRPLPQHLADLVRIDLEEHLWSRAFNLLEASLVSGTGTVVPAHIPGPEYFALCSTLIVHPSLTSRTLDADKHAASNSAFRYLRHVNDLVGPRNAGLVGAFGFDSGSRSGMRDRRSRLRRQDIKASCGASDDVDHAIREPFAQKEALWRNADDFWSVVGWAFNCSIVYPKRWQYWKRWLSFMLDVMEDDLHSRLSGNESQEVGSIEESLIARYLGDIGQARTNKRRVMRAIFVDGNSKSLAEFREVWRNETRPPPKPKNEEGMVKRQKLDFDAGEFADYLDSGSDDGGLSSRAASRSRSRRQSRQPSSNGIHSRTRDPDMLDEIIVRSDKRSQRGNADEDMDLESDESEGSDEFDDDRNIHVDSLALANGATFSKISIQAFGDIDSIKLRQRLLALLSDICAACPALFADVEELYDLYTEFIRPLPLPLFQQFVNPATQYLGPAEKTLLDRTLLRTLLESSASKHPWHGNDQIDFIQWIAPFAANSTSLIDNAKVSLIIEDVLRAVWQTKKFDAPEELRSTIELGITQRREKAASDGRRKANVRLYEEEDATRTLVSSAARLRMYIDMMCDGSERV